MRSPAGIATAKAVRGAAAGFGADSARHQPRAPAAAINAATTHAFRLARGRAITGVAAGGAESTTSSISIRASAMSRNRVRVSRSRQRRRTRLTEGGVSGGNALQSGSDFRIAASVSDTVSPSNALRPASIS